MVEVIPLCKKFVIEEFVTRLLVFHFIIIICNILHNVILRMQLS